MSTQRTIAFRASDRLEKQLEAIALRDGGNGLSATIRRLISIGLRSEERRDAGQ